jgi:maltose-binding protein MalE
MKRSQAMRFALEWIDAWNSHDLNKILSHYSEEIEYHSIFVEQMMIDQNGKIDNKSDLGIYFSIALSKYPELCFQFKRVYTGAQSILISYKSVNSKLAAEYVRFDKNGKINFVSAHYD